MANFASFTIKDADAWQKYVEKNTGAYGGEVIAYSARWASMVEGALLTGAVFEDVVAPLSHEADINGITGFMYWAAVSTLSKVWEYGEQLRLWHNNDIAPKQAEETNAIPGAVLNPALISVSLPPSE